MGLPTRPTSKPLAFGRVAVVPRGLGLVLALALAGCSGTPFGEALSRSFSDPATPSAPDTTSASGAARAPGTNGAPGTAAASPPAAPNPAASTSPAAGTKTGTKAAGTPQVGTPQVGTPQAGTALSTATTPAAATPRPGSPPPAAPSTARRPPAAPVPYRVTLRLPQADPAAPAEVVTEALRGAGVPFEVETIERLEVPSAAPATPSVRPAPAPAPASPR
jgi:hypothetical protein